MAEDVTLPHHWFAEQRYLLERAKAAFNCAAASCSALLDRLTAALWGNAHPLPTVLLRLEERFVDPILKTLVLAANVSVSRSTARYLTHSKR